MAASIWREAVDPASGRTYFYHLITRETTWDKPAQLTDEVEGVSPKIAGANAADYLTRRQGVSQEASGAGEW